MLHGCPCQHGSLARKLPKGHCQKQPVHPEFTPTGCVVVVVVAAAVAAGSCSLKVYTYGVFIAAALASCVAASSALQYSCPWMCLISSMFRVCVDQVVLEMELKRLQITADGAAWLQPMEVTSRTCSRQ